MRRNEYRQSRNRAGMAIIKLALIMLVALMAAFVLPVAQAKDKPPEQFTQVYRHTYDEVFQAAQDSIERLGWFVTGTDKVKGIVSCRFSNPATSNITFDLHVETVNQEPETRVTIVFIKTGRTSKDSIWHDLSTELQKVLSTYR